MSTQGHRTVAHTADMCVEAWADSRAECIAEAVHGLIAGFADVTEVEPRRVVQRRLTADSDEDLLVAVLDEIIYRMDAYGEIPVRAVIAPADDECAVTVTLAVAGVDDVEIIGAVPKGVSLHEVRCAPDDRTGWSCAVIIDV